MNKWLAVFFLLGCFINIIQAQQPVGIAYSRENVFVDNPDKIDLIANVGGNHHLMSFNYTEKPKLFLYNNKLELTQKITLPFVLPERAIIKITRLAGCYYISIHKQYSVKYQLFKIDSNGYCTDLTTAFKKLLRMIPYEVEPEFELVPAEKGLFFTYHTDFGNTEKNTLILVKTDSLLNAIFAHKVVYEFKRYEENLRQETIMFGTYLLVVKTARSNTALEVMKVNLATGYTIRNSFYSAGYLYSQPVAMYNPADSGITVSALLADMGYFSSRNYIFISRLNKILVEKQAPVILKTQFAKNTGTNFLLPPQGRWVRLTRGGPSRSYSSSGTNYQNYSRHDSSMLPAVINPVATGSEKYVNWYDQEPGVRFSLMDKGAMLINERYVANSKNNYSLLTNKFTRFTASGKEYMLIGQRFGANKDGLLMVYSNDGIKLEYTNIGVNFRNEYILSKGQPVGQNRIIMPYTHRRFAGLLQLTIAQ
jgi:hypothetical protein